MASSRSPSLSTLPPAPQQMIDEDTTNILVMLMKMLMTGAAAPDEDGEDHMEVDVADDCSFCPKSSLVTNSTGNCNNDRCVVYVGWIWFKVLTGGSK
mmetsp:Transcript_61360/g.150190  ORF Transcript_61360/g.150190 Transcript_61360/m.150190 type:complete len:97 (+) Transcript_61360:906-1196(+)